MNIGKAIKDLREAAGLSLEQLEDKSGRKASYLEKIEQGTATPGAGDIEAICEAMEVPKEILSILAIESRDVKKGKEDLYEALMPAIRNLALALVTKSEE